MAAAVSYSAEDYIMDSRPSHVTFASSKDINDVESGLGNKGAGEKAKQLVCRGAKRRKKGKSNRIPLYLESAIIFYIVD